MSNKFHFSFVLLLAFSAVAFLAIACTNATPTNSPIISTGSYPAPSLGIVIDKTLQVLSVAHGSMAETQIQSGDRLVSLNGVQLKSPKQARDVFRKSKPNQPLTLVLQRNGQPLTLVIPFSTGSPSFVPGTIPPTVTPVPPDFMYF